MCFCLGPATASSWRHCTGECDDWHVVYYTPIILQFLGDQATTNKLAQSMRNQEPQEHNTKNKRCTKQPKKQKHMQKNEPSTRPGNNIQKTRLPIFIEFPDFTYFHLFGKVTFKKALRKISVSGQHVHSVREWHHFFCSSLDTGPQDGLGHGGAKAQMGQRSILLKKMMNK